MIILPIIAIIAIIALIIGINVGNTKRQASTLKNDLELVLENIQNKDPDGAEKALELVRKDTDTLNNTLNNGFWGTVSGIERVKNEIDTGKELIGIMSNAEEKIMTSEQLLECRDRMNKFYSAFTIITTMFPLLGMLGTVISLIPMVDTIGAAETQLFFGALTSTFWGIVSALFCKFLDIFIGFKIEDSEKHVEFLLNPKRNREES